MLLLRYSLLSAFFTLWLFVSPVFAQGVPYHILPQSLHPGKVVIQYISRQSAAGGAPTGLAPLLRRVQSIRNARTATTALMDFLPHAWMREWKLFFEAIGAHTLLM